MGILRDLNRRGLELVVSIGGDTSTWDEKKCRNHKITNVLNVLPKRARNEVGEYIKENYLCGDGEEFDGLRDEFVNS